MYSSTVSTFCKARAEKVKRWWTLLTAWRDLGQTDASAEIRVLGEAIVIWCAGLSVQCVPDLSDTFQAFLRVSPTPTVSPVTPHSIPLFQCESNILATPPFLPPSPPPPFAFSKDAKENKDEAEEPLKTAPLGRNPSSLELLSIYVHCEKSEKN